MNWANLGFSAVSIALNVAIGYCIARQRDERRRQRELVAARERVDEILSSVKASGRWIEPGEFVELVKAWPGFSNLYWMVRPPWPVGELNAKWPKAATGAAN